MKKVLLILLLPILIGSCNSNKQIELLDANDFASEIKEHPDAVLIDVRTQEEFASGNIEGAVNISMDDPEFESKMSLYDKNTPLFIYCLGGSRSKDATEKLIALGFNKIYELKGGITAWNSAGLNYNRVLINEKMNEKDLKNLISKHDKILVDFYAEWCGPCKQMEPFLIELTQELENKVKIVRIDVDKHPELTSNMKIQAIPSLFFYETGNLRWQHEGFMGKEVLLNKMLGAE